VTNSADRDYDEGLWDQLLARFMPERPIWGFGTDDMHSLSGVKLSYSVFLLDRLNDSNVRQAMETGQFYFTRANNSVSYLEGPPNIDVFPVVTNIEVCEEGNTVAISAENYTEIRWISVDEPADKIEKGNIVHRGPQVKLDELRGVGSFIRVEIENQAGVTYLQPFGTGPISNL